MPAQHQECQAKGEKNGAASSRVNCTWAAEGSAGVKLSPETAAIKTFSHCPKNSVLPESSGKFIPPCSEILGDVKMTFFNLP